ncbi:MAG: hypothetical protein QM692_13010 [Thermomicrobiales bacterium]
MPIFGRKQKQPAVPQEMPIAVAVGKNHRLELYQSRLRVAGNPVRDIYISSIESIVFNSAGRIVEGWLKVEVFSGPQTAFVITLNEFQFNRKQQASFEHLRDELNRLIARRVP